MHSNEATRGEKKSLYTYFFVQWRAFLRKLRKKKEHSNKLEICARNDGKRVNQRKALQPFLYVTARHGDRTRWKRRKARMRREFLILIEPWLHSYCCIIYKVWILTRIFPVIMPSSILFLKAISALLFSFFSLEWCCNLLKRVKKKAVIMTSIVFREIGASHQPKVDASNGAHDNAQRQSSLLAARIRTIFLLLFKVYSLLKICVYIYNFFFIIILCVRWTHATISIKIRNLSSSPRFMMRCVHACYLL